MTGESKAVRDLVEQIEPILHGHPPDIQGAVLGDLVSTWLDGHHPGLRERVLQMHIKYVRDLVAIRDAEFLRKLQ